MNQRVRWSDVVGKLNTMLGTYEMSIKRDIAMPTRPDGSTDGGGVYVYRVALRKGGVTVSQAGADQPEVVLPNLAIRLLSDLDRPQPTERSSAAEAFESAIETVVLERELEPEVVTPDGFTWDGESRQATEEDDNGR